MDAIQAVGYARGVKGAADNEPAALIDLVVNHVNGTWANGVLTGVESAATAANVDVVISVARESGDWGVPAPPPAVAGRDSRACRPYVEPVLRTPGSADPGRARHAHE